MRFRRSRKRCQWRPPLHQFVFSNFTKRSISKRTDILRATRRPFVNRSSEESESGKRIFLSQHSAKVREPLRSDRYVVKKWPGSFYICRIPRPGLVILNSKQRLLLHWMWLHILNAKRQRLNIILSFFRRREQNERSLN